MGKYAGPYDKVRVLIYNLCLVQVTSYLLHRQQCTTYCLLADEGGNGDKLKNYGKVALNGENMRIFGRYGIFEVDTEDDYVVWHNTVREISRLFKGTNLEDDTVTDVEARESLEKALKLLRICYFDLFW